MPIMDVRPQGGPLMPAPEPRRKYTDFKMHDEPYVIMPGDGTYYDSGLSNPLVTTWVTRWQQWRAGFEQIMAGRLRKYWSLWRNFDQGASPGPGQEWRDRTVIPQAYKELATRIPRIVLGMWGVPEPYTIRGRGYKDEEYEEMVRQLIELSLDQIGTNDPQCETFLKRMVDGTTYSQIIGHVFWKLFWRKETGWLKTKLPIYATDGRIDRWDPVELLHVIYDNVDIVWLPVTHLAIDLYGKNRWRIELIKTSLESLISENERFRKENGRDLYPGLDSLKLESLGPTPTRDQTDEPRDTEQWPMDDGLSYTDPNETPVELWLCWDNVDRTLTKIANRKCVLAHGLADTPNGMDPYISDPAVPIPNCPYGDSILNWTGPLHIRQTRISRARADQTLLNMFTQYLVAEGSLPNTTWFWRPGGMAPVSRANPDKPLSDVIYQVPTKPLPPEAYNEEAYVQRTSESVAGADSSMQGVEATSKSRDVTAAEINQRVVQGASRYQLEVLYKGAVLKRPLLQKVFDLLQQNLTQPRLVQIFDDYEGQLVDLTQIRRPIDIIIGDPSTEATVAERLQELDRLIMLSKGDNMLSMWLKPREILVEMLRATRTLRRNTAKFVKTEEERQSEMEREAAMAAQQAGPAGQGPQPRMEGEGRTPLPAPGAPGPPGIPQLAGPTGATPEGLAPPSEGRVEAI